jgi:hypothetical protein
LTYGALVGVIGETITSPEASIPIVAVSTTPVEAPLMVHELVTVAEI